LARKRAAATRGVFAIEDPALVFPARVALDTSLMVRAVVETQPLPGICLAFLARLRAAGTTLVISDLLEAELAEAVFGLPLSERWGRGWRRYRIDGRTRRPARKHMADARKKYWQLIAPAEHVAAPISAVIDQAVSLMSDYGLASYDAVHAATAIAAGAEGIATTDAGFGLLPSSLLTIYTDRSRLVSCRAKRPRR
jgi:predicted nucleic acid-binding protein